MNALTTSISLEKVNNQTGGLSPDLDQIVRGCLANDRAAQETLYRRYYGKMMATCMRYLKNEDDAQEVLNTGFLKVFQNLDTYTGHGSFDGWVYLIIRNAIIDQLRKRVRYREESLDITPEYAITVESGVLENLYAQDLMSMLHKLPETSRLVFNMFAIEGFKHEEIAQTLGISVGTSKWHVSESRRILRDNLEQLKAKNHGQK